MLGKWEKLMDRLGMKKMHYFNSFIFLPITQLQVCLDRHIF